MGRKLAEITDLTKSYGNSGFQSQVIRGISMDIYEGDFLAVMGPSGAGKTTFWTGRTWAGPGTGAFQKSAGIKSVLFSRNTICWTI